MLRIKANKTSLYKLVASHEQLPGMRKTEFVKAHRQPDYWLKWHDIAADRFCDAFIAVCGGRPLLVITAKDWDGHETRRQVYTLTTEDLRERGMVEDFTAKVKHRRPESVAR